MKRARLMTPPPSRRKLAGLIGGSLLLVAVTGTFTYARFRNDAARRRVVAACEVIKRDEHARKAALDGAAKLVPGKGDADKIASIERATRTSRVCEPLAAQLSGYKWNFGRHWAAPPVDAASLPSREEIAAIGARAKPRCVAQVGMFLELSNGASGPSQEKRQELLDLCDLEKRSENALTAPTSVPLRLLDEWPAELERRAATVAPAPQPATSLD